MLQKSTAGRIIRCGGVVFAAAGASLLGAGIAPRPPPFFLTWRLIQVAYNDGGGLRHKL